jgi:hypothetical protein
MDAVFTIITKNYLPQARTLGDSIKNFHPNLDFFMVLADETEGQIDLKKEKYPVIETKDMGIASYRDMAFKYDLVEFCTSMKPFIFEYFFNKYGYEKIIYFDPDIYIYSELNIIDSLLDDHFVILTPHLTQLEGAENGTKPADDYLRCGVFNLGFIAFKNSPKGRALLTWWRTKTQNKGYADFADGLYVDQKWADCFPCFDEDGIGIARHPGLNVAHWNMHERVITRAKDGYLVNNQDLVFFHFSGFDPSNPDVVTRPHGKGPVGLQGRPEYQELFGGYRKKLLENQNGPSANSYAYSRFDNGVWIYGFQRRLYRSLADNGLTYDNPFSTAPHTYYDLLRANKMLILTPAAKGEFRKSDIAEAERKLKTLTKAMLLMKRIMGIRYYHLLIRALNTLSRPEEQTFLLKTLNTNIPIQFR